LRHFSCPVMNCDKSYGSEGSLYQHIKIKHPSCNIKSITDIYEMIKENKKNSQSKVILADGLSPSQPEESNPLISTSLKSLDCSSNHNENSHSEPHSSEPQYTEMHSNSDALNTDISSSNDAITNHSFNA